MTTVLFKGSRVVGLPPNGESPYTGTLALKKFDGVDYDRVQDAWDWKSFEEVRSIAMYLTAITGRTYLGVDNSESVSPRFDVIQAPMIGDPVSYGFNGDYTPDGVVVKISKTYQVTTSTGSVYRRRGLRGSWMKAGGTWGLVRGHIDERNPHF